MALSTKTLSDIFDFARAGTGGYTDSDGNHATAAANEPRYHHDGSGNALGILIEEQRENLAPYSEDHTQWSRLGLTNAAATVLANGIGGVEYDDSDLNRYFVWDASNGAIITVETAFDVASSATPARQEHTFTTPAGCTSVIIYMTRKSGGAKLVSANISGLTASTEYSASWYHEYDGAKYKAGGLQVEEGSGPTSYYPTAGAAQIRAKDTCPANATWFNNTWNQSAGTIFVEFNIPVVKSWSALVCVSDGTANNNIQISFNDSSKIICGLVVAGAWVGYLDLGAYTPGTTAKVAMAFDGASMIACLNGGAVAEDTAVSIPPGLTGLSIGHFHWSNGGAINGTIGDFWYSRTKHANADLQAVTA